MTAQPLSRRDRAACVLAYESIRHAMPVGPIAACVDVEDVFEACRGGELPRAVLVALKRATEDLVRTHQPWPRLLRARLALLLRAVLRADAGDYGKLTCNQCGHRHPTWRAPGDVGRGCAVCWDAPKPPYDGRYALQRVTPLWELAAARKAAP